MLFNDDPFGLTDFFSPEKKKKSKSDLKDYTEPDMFADVQPFDAGFGFSFGNSIPDEISGLENLGNSIGHNKLSKVTGEKLKNFRKKKFKGVRR